MTLSINICYLIQAAYITLTSFSLVMSSTTWPALPLLLLIHSKDDLLTQSAANLFPVEHSSLEESVQKPQRKTTFQCRLRIAAQETKPIREKDEFKSKFAIQALSYATCPSDNSNLEVFQSFSK